MLGNNILKSLDIEIASSQNDLIQILGEGAGGEAGGSGEEIIQDLQTSGGAQNQQQNQDLANSLTGS